MDKLYFYSKSKHARAGKGTNEHAADPELYRELDTIPGWRRVLSNFHVAPFTYKGYTYRTIEHAFQAAKIALMDPEKALWFTVEHSHEGIGEGDGAAAQKHRKLVLLTPEKIKAWGRESRVVMGEIAKAKYAQCDQARHVLVSTGRAELWHIVSRGRPERFVHLEEIRDTLLFM